MIEKSGARVLDWAGGRRLTAALPAQMEQRYGMPGHIGMNIDRAICRSDPMGRLQQLKAFLALQFRHLFGTGFLRRAHRLPGRISIGVDVIDPVMRDLYPGRA